MTIVMINELVWTGMHAYRRLVHVLCWAGYCYLHMASRTDLICWMGQCMALLFFGGWRH